MPSLGDAGSAFNGCVDVKLNGCLKWTFINGTMFQFKNSQYIILCLKYQIAQSDYYFAYFPYIKTRKYV